MFAGMSAGMTSAGKTTDEMVIAAATIAGQMTVARTIAATMTGDTATAAMWSAATWNGAMMTVIGPGSALMNPQVPTENEEMAQGAAVMRTGMAVNLVREPGKTISVEGAFMAARTVPKAAGAAAVKRARDMPAAIVMCGNPTEAVIASVGATHVGSREGTCRNPPGRREPSATVKHAVGPGAEAVTIRTAA